MVKGWSRGDQSEGKWVVKGVTEKFFLYHWEEKDGRVLELKFEGPVWPKILAEKLFLLPYLNNILDILWLAAGAC